MTTKICVLCEKKFIEYGNNPFPLADSYKTCCDECNETKVIPARLNHQFDGSKK